MEAAAATATAAAAAARDAALGAVRVGMGLPTVDELAAILTFIDLMAWSKAKPEAWAAVDRRAMSVVLGMLAIAPVPCLAEKWGARLQNSKAVKKLHRGASLSHLLSHSLSQVPHQST